MDKMLTISCVYGLTFTTSIKDNHDIAVEATPTEDISVEPVILCIRLFFKDLINC
jgi:hypothetical protein